MDIKQITARLEQGVEDVFESDKYRAYLATMGRFYNYSFGNCLLIAMQRPGATMVAGFKAWQTKFNRNVKKGEKGIQILAPCPCKKRVEAVQADGSVEEREVVATYFRAAYVWDISQTEGEELPTIAARLTDGVEGYDGIIDKLVGVAPVPVAFEDINGSANGFYSRTEKRIVVRQGMSQSQTVKTLLHEITHSILHNKEDGAQKDADRRTMEVQAESVAFAVCAHLGIDASEYSFGYIAGWTSGRDHAELKQSLEIIHSTATEIIQKLEAA